MQTLKLRNIGPQVSRVAFGAEPMGGFEWGNVNLDEIDRAVGVARELGVNLFDTADCYGKGLSEIRLGKALGENRKSVVLASKFGVRFDGNNRAYYDNDPEYIERALDDSLSRLNTDYLDLYQLHWPDDHTPLESVFDKLDELIKSGRIRAYGVTNVAPLKLAPHVSRPGFVTFSLQYSLAHRDQQDAIARLCEAGLVFLSWGTLGQGLLSGRYKASHVWPENDRRRRAAYANFHGEALAQNMARVARLREVASREGFATPAMAAVRFVLDTLPRAIALVGVKSREQIAQTAAAGSVALSAANLSYLAEDRIED